MYVWSPFPFVRFTISLIIGILLHQVFDLDDAVLWVLTLAVIVLLAAFLRSRQNQSTIHEVSCGLSVSVLFVVLGYWLSFNHKDNIHAQHYAHLDGVDAYQAHIVSDFSDRKDYHRYEVELEAVVVEDSVMPTFGRLFLYIRKQDSLEVFEYGDQLFVKGGFYPIQSPGNPHEFDYKAYLETLNIYAHSFVSLSDISKVGLVEPNFFIAVSSKIRRYCKYAIRQVIPAPREQSILLALLVGVKDYLDEETTTAYSQAGAMHVLAVSGLHVGIVYIILSFVFGFLKRNDAGKLLFIMMSVVLIWLYAAVTGFSPSVLRASVMFSVILISQTVSRKANIYNSLGIAALCLLLYDPNLIFAVGFQLSFAAVLGIVFLQPRLSGVWRPKNIAVQYLWEITCVSVAAQLATFPLTVYYFHQFPTYFLVSNLIVIPSSGFILAGGLIAVTLYAVFAPLGIWLGTVLYWLMWIVNELMAYLVKLPLPVIDWLYFDFWDTVLVYSLILLVSIALDYQLKRVFQFTLVLLLCFFIRGTLVYADQLGRDEVIFYEIKNHIAIDFIAEGRAALLIDSLSVDEREVVGFQVNPNRLASGLKKVSEDWRTFKESEEVIKTQFGYLIQKQGLSVMIVNTADPLTIRNSPSCDLLYLNAYNPDVLKTVHANHYLLGANLGYYQVQRLRGDEALKDLSLHSLKLDGYYKLN